MDELVHSNIAIAQLILFSSFYSNRHSHTNTDAWPHPDLTWNVKNKTGNFHTLQWKYQKKWGEIKIQKKAKQKQKKTKQAATGSKKTCKECLIQIYVHEEKLKKHIVIAFTSFSVSWPGSPS
jgi:hypothetical protein